MIQSEQTDVASRGFKLPSRTSYSLSYKVFHHSKTKGRSMEAVSLEVPPLLMLRVRIKVVNVGSTTGPLGTREVVSLIVYIC